MKQKTKRSQVKYPALDTSLNLKTRADQIEIDYFNKLPAEWVDPHTGKKWSNDQLKQYLNDFTAEAILADFKNPVRIHRKRKVESEKNKPLKQLINDLNIKIVEFIEIITQANINTKLKGKLKKSVYKHKKGLKKQIQDNFAYIKDYYKNDAEHKNNARNRCILTKARAQGKVMGMEDLSPYLTETQDIEDQLIEQIDNKRLEDE